jgi:hypothetical protein
MDTGAALGGTGLFISLVGIIYSAINHKHIRANCCGRNIEFSVDIDSTDPEAKAKEEKENEEKEAKERLERDLKEQVPDTFTKHFKVHPITIEN